MNEERNPERPVVRPDVVEALAQRIAALLEPRICQALEDIANDLKELR